MRTLLLLWLLVYRSCALEILFDFIHVSGMGFHSTTETNASVTTKSLCSCRQQCFSQSFCNAWTASKVNAHYECHFSIHGPQPPTSPSPQPGAVYSYKITGLSGLIDVHEGTDGDMYFVPDKELNFSTAINYCQNIPGFQLALLKTREQIEIANTISLQIQDSFHIHLTHKDPSTQIWGDGTELTEDLKDLVKIPWCRSTSNIGTTYRVKDSGIHIICCRRDMYFLCQSKTDNGLQ
ncbi:putative Lectin C-type domain-containing protein 12 [Homarus americanus]|uniref:Putative Lectin C-type domain-containing protein 12 n=2 Tax=Homarus americanus TaxID=6706 RepID=A0A8J5JMF1_HOMAM|nr:putative Lectin C-type domain-containing protein 12 [Homarus americanus]